MKEREPQAPQGSNSNLTIYFLLTSHVLKLAAQTKDASSITGPDVAPCFEVSVSVLLGCLSSHCGVSDV